MQILYIHFYVSPTRLFGNLLIQLLARKKTFTQAHIKIYNNISVYSAN